MKKESLADIMCKMGETLVVVSFPRTIYTKCRHCNLPLGMTREKRHGHGIGCKGFDWTSTVDISILYVYTYYFTIADGRGGSKKSPSRWFYTIEKMNARNEDRTMSAGDGGIVCACLVVHA